MRNRRHALSGNKLHQGKSAFRKNNLPQGVTYYPERLTPYRAAIMHNGKRTHLGWFDTPEEASAAYDVARDIVLRENYPLAHKSKAPGPCLAAFAALRRALGPSFQDPAVRLALSELERELSK